MKRRDFLKRLGIGAAAITVIPATASSFTRQEDGGGVFIDINSLYNISAGGRHLTPAEILDLWRQTGILIYNSKGGNAPMPIDKDIEVIDICRYKR